jgi:predicted lactoylglutathione lyase
MYLNVPVKAVAAREFYPKMGCGKNEQLSSDQNAVMSIDEGSMSRPRRC